MVIDTKSPNAKLLTTKNTPKHQFQDKDVKITRKSNSKRTTILTNHNHVM